MKGKRGRERRYVWYGGEGEGWKIGRKTFHPKQSLLKWENWKEKSFGLSMHFHFLTSNFFFLIFFYSKIETKQDRNLGSSK